MKTFLRATVAVVLLISTLHAAEPAPKRLRVLFIGNSLTATNNLPEVLAAMARASERELVVGRNLVGGATLEKHWSEGKALAKIKQGPWDYVVLQDLSTEAYKDRDSMFRHAKMFDEEIHKAGAKTALYMTWSLENEPDKFVAIQDAYTTLGKDLKATVVPAGVAWQSITKAGGQPAAVLYKPDHKHPTPSGTYLAACVFYHTLFGAPSKGLPATFTLGGKPLIALPPAEAELLQKSADAAAASPTP